MIDAKQEVKEVLDDAKKVQDILAKYDITNKEYLHSLPVMLAEFYPEKKVMIDELKLIVKEAVAFHEMMYKKR